MKKIKEKIIYAGLAVFTAFICAVSCTDRADYYQTSKDVTGRSTLWELISQQPELSTFAALLKKVSYDHILSGDQAYTVWAPENEALTGIDPNDEVAVLRVVTNHIARYASPTSVAEAGDQILYMMSAKKLLFSSSGNSFFMGGVELDRKNLAASNGILHTLKKQIAFDANIWQFVENAGYDSIRSYLYSFNKKQFYPNASTPIDYNEEGMIVYDSVFYDQNELWYVYAGADGIGWLNNEDSLYTMIVPDNQAWKEVYDNTVNYFRPDPNLRNPDSMQVANTRYSIVQDLVFRGAINPGSYSETDTLFSTRYAPFINPSRLFTGLTPVPVSNGWVYPTSHLNYELSELTVKPIKVEAEYAAGRWFNPQTDLASLYIYHSDLPDISNHYYLYVMPSYSGAQPSVSFELPNVLTAEYNIYCVCLAQAYTDNLKDSTLWRSTRLKFEIHQWDRVGKKEDNKSWKTIATFSEPISSTKYVTKPYGISKILVTENFKFPFANFREDDNVFRLKVTCALDRTDPTTKFRNEVRIDYILLESSH